MSESSAASTHDALPQPKARIRDSGARRAPGARRHPLQHAALVDLLAKREPVNDLLHSIAVSYALEGESLELCLRDVDRSFRQAVGSVADGQSVRQVSLVWAEIAQSRYSMLGCADPLTGLATLAHLRSALAAGQRAGHGGGSRHMGRSLVVVDVPPRAESTDSGSGPLEQGLRQALAAEILTKLFPDYEQAAALTHRRVGIVVRQRLREQQLVHVAETLDGRLGLHPEAPGCRVWVRPLPDHLDELQALLDELSSTHDPCPEDAWGGKGGGA